MVLTYPDLAPLYALLDQADEKKPVVLALDGFCASGKSTWASYLSEQYGARVIHTDDFYLPAPMRSQKRYAEPGGTIHYERLRAEVIDCLSAPALTYGVFDMGTFSVGSTVTLPFSPVTVVEGAYASHPAFGDYATVRCFMETSPEEQRRRILERNGLKRLKMFEARWIPYEKAYEKAFGIREKADFVILT